MALHTRKQFAELLGLDYKIKNVRTTITMWVKRGNVIEKNDLIDDTDPQNSYWIKKQASKPAKIPKVEAVETGAPPLDSMPSLPAKEKSSEKTNKNASPKDKHNLDLEKKELEIEKLKVDTRLQELKEEKIRGEVIPISLVKQLFNTFSQAVLTAHKEADDYLLIRISKEYQLSGEQLARLRGGMVKDLNSAVEKSIKMTEKNIKSLVQEFSVKKEVGEHE